MHRCPTSKCVLFLSTPSMRRATFPAFLHSLFFFISIHALHEEGDGAPQALPLLLDNFYPRPP